jgi:5-formaminoimidazole-4-carboxamide-1-beta-D-ribofuranosyl 5'-monophosphate synthetase
MRKLLTKKDFAEFWKYRNTMGGNKFEKCIDNIQLEMNYHHRNGGQFELYNTENDKIERFHFGEDVSFDFFENEINKRMELIK